MRFVASIDINVHNRTTVSDREVSEFIREMIERDILMGVKATLDLDRRYEHDCIEVSVMHINDTVIKNVRTSMEYASTVLKMGSTHSKLRCVKCNCYQISHERGKLCVGNAENSCTTHCRAFKK